MKKYFKIILPLLLAIMVATPTVWAQGTVFVDVPYDHWARESIESIYERGVIRGRGYGIFDPETNVTRQELMWMLENFFTEGIEFTEAERIGLNQFISRIDTFTILARAFSLEGDVEDLLNYVDLMGLNVIQLSALAAMQNAAGLVGFIDSVTGVRTAQPHGFLTRAQAARILDNLITFTESYVEADEEQEVIEDEQVELIEITSVRINNEVFQTGDVARAYVTPSTATVIYEWRIQVASEEEDNSRVISTAPYFELANVGAGNILILTVTGYGVYEGQASAEATILSGNRNNQHYIRINNTNPRVGDTLSASIIYGGTGGEITWVSCDGRVMGRGDTLVLTLRDLDKSISAQLLHGTQFAISSRWTAPTQLWEGATGYLWNLTIINDTTQSIVAHSFALSAEDVPSDVMEQVRIRHYGSAHSAWNELLSTMVEMPSNGDALRVEVYPDLDVNFIWLVTPRLPGSLGGAFFTIEGDEFHVRPEHWGTSILLVAVCDNYEYLGFVSFMITWQN